MRLAASLIFAVGWLLANGSLAATITIDQLEDVDFGSVAPSSRGVRQRMRFCVSSTPAGPFRLTAYGTAVGGGFGLTNGAAETIEYQVYIGGSVSRRGRRVHAGIPVTGLTARQPHPTGNCRRPLMLTLQIPRTALAGAPGGEYSGQLAITVAPE